MPLESASYPTQLNASNPGGTDDYSTADDHLRLIKAVLQATFPNVNGAVSGTPTELNRLVGITSALEQQGNKNIASGYAGLNGSSQLANAQVAAGNVTQHQASLSIAFTQLTGSIANGQVPVGAVTQHQASLAVAFTQLTGSIANGQVPVGAVTQHQASLAIAGSQVSSGTLPDARIAITGVTQHQASLSIAFTQLTGSIANGQVPVGAVTQHQASLSIAFTQLTGSIANGQVPVGAVTQHQASIAAPAGSLTGGTLASGVTASSLTSVAAGCTVGGIEIGFRRLPSASVTTGSIAAADSNKCVYASAGVTVPNSTFAQGDVVSIYNNTAGNITLTLSPTTTWFNGASAGSSKTLAARQLATILFISGTEMVLNGSGIS